MSKDIGLILHDWDANPDEVTVRRINGMDGSPKIQMRLDLGVLQMETEGRPDGKRPYGYESLLEYYEDRLARYRILNGDDEGYELDSEACGALKQESMQYYYRYLSLFHLGDYSEVIRDTQRNLRMFDFLTKWAAIEEDRGICEQFRPYVLMMNTRAKACLQLESQDYDMALQEIDAGIERIEDFFLEMERSDMIESCRELVFLHDWSARIRDNRPLTPAERLRRELSSAVECEDYERAAQLRDQIRELAL
jgi:tetratricopeptide (TPR) repeat protein